MRARTICVHQAHCVHQAQKHGPSFVCAWVSACAHLAGRPPTTHPENATTLLAKFASISKTIATPPTPRSFGVMDDVVYLFILCRLLETGVSWDDTEIEMCARGTVSAGGVCARRNIAKGRSIIKIPKSACLCWRTGALAQSLKASRVGVSLPGGPRLLSLDDVPDTVRLVLCLLHEIDLGAKSRWAPYLATMPNCDAGVPLLWPSADLKLLDGTELEEHCVTKRKETSAEWHTHIAPLAKQHPALFRPSSHTYDQYAKACTLVSSRSFTIDELHGCGMIPFADLFNHSTTDAHLQFADEVR